MEEEPISSEDGFFNRLLRTDIVKLRIFYEAELKKYEYVPAYGEPLIKLEKCLRAARDLWQFTDKVIRPQSNTLIRVWAKTSTILQGFLQAFGKFINQKNPSPTKGILELPLTGCGLSELLPAGFEWMPWHHIGTIKAGKNRIHEISIKIAHTMPRVTRVDLSGNRLKGLPENLLGGWWSVEEMDLSNNPLKNFPFTELGSLKTLILVGTQIPEEVLIAKAAELGKVGITVITTKAEREKHMQVEEEKS